jgi:hypothetical protein
LCAGLYAGETRETGLHGSITELVDFGQENRIQLKLIYSIAVQALTERVDAVILRWSFGWINKSPQLKLLNLW